MSEQTIRLIHIVLDSFLPLLKAGVVFTVPLTLISFVLGIVVAFFTARARLSQWRPFAGVARFYVWVIRGTPLLVQLFVIFYGLPNLGITINAFPAAVIGFTLSVGAYNSEVIRAAILSIPEGQWEAAYAIGMTRQQALRRIVMPQAIKVAIPPLFNSFISLVKDTSLAATITVTELFQKAEEITAATYEPLTLYCEAGLIYLLFSSVLSSLQARLENRLDRQHAKS